MPARVLDACDAVVADIVSAWSPTAPSAAQREYAPEIGFSVDHAETLLSGRQVYVFPAAWGSPEGVTRGELLHEYTVSVVVAERYTAAAGPVPKAWVDERVLFVETLFNRLKDPTRELTGASVTLFRTPDVPAEVDEVYDLDMLAEQRAFWSRFTITYHEIVGVAGS